MFEICDLRFVPDSNILRLTFNDPQTP